MRRYQKWLTTLGVFALTPSLALAGPFSFGKKAAPPQSAAAAPAASASRPSSNQRTAEYVAEALRRANLSGYDIEIQVQGGKAILTGQVASLQQKQAASSAVSAVPGVSAVDNRLSVSAAAPTAGPAPAPAQQAQARSQAQFQQAQAQQAQAQQALVQQAALQQAAAQRQFAQQGVRRVNFQEGEEAIPAPMPAGIAPPPPGPPGMAPAPFGGGAPMGAPMSGMVYDQPNFPNHAWPSYAAYPNYAQVTYPNQYSASAWPYIGPFYPYPQVPLGWRKVQLEWDDGYWNLNFRPRTDRWWWFMDYRNW